MTLNTITKGKGAVPGKAKERSDIVLLKETYVTGGEVITAAQLGCRRIVEVVPLLLVSNATEATPVTSAAVEITGGGTGIKLKMLNGKTAAELGNGVTVAGVKVELLIAYF